MWPHFLVFGAVTAACYLAAVALAPSLDSLPSKAVRGLSWAYPAMASVAAAIAVRGSNAKRAYIYAGAAAVLVTTGAAIAAVIGGRR
jgi:PTS system mannose-specific IIC component